MATILHANSRRLQTPAFVEGRSHGRSHQVCDNLRRGTLGHSRKRFVCGLGSYQRAKGSLREKPIMTKQTVAVEHIHIESAKSFADVRAALERSVPHLDPGLVKALADGDVERADREKEEGPELSIFQVRDHGAMLEIAGGARNALQYDIGNPVTASLMTRHRLAAALYPPIRVVLYENDSGHGVFEYDQPSTTFGQFGDERVTAVARGLDAALARALLGAAE
jgi:hypothetical protein